MKLKKRPSRMPKMDKVLDMTGIAHLKALYVAREAFLNGVGQKKKIGEKKI